MAESRPDGLVDVPVGEVCQVAFHHVSHQIVRYRRENGAMVEALTDCGQWMVRDEASKRVTREVWPCPDCGEVPPWPTVNCNATI